MQRMTAVVGALIVFGTAILDGQSQQRRRIVGDRIGGHLALDTRTQTTTDTATLTFTGNDGGPALTVDFTTRYQGLGRPTSTPRAVDVIVTQLPANDDVPAMTMRVNGEAVPTITRLRSRQSMVTTVSFEEFVRVTNADTLVQQAFDSELEFSAGQLRMLREIADRWSVR